jgi:hypothetical protein
MANSNKVFVSPGVYTSEKDLTFVAQSVGVTTLGLSGETLKGPAFETVLVSNFDDFKTYFGPTSPEKDSAGNPKYELPYVAKSYLQESNQLFVTRVLGLTGYKPNKTFGIKAVGGITVGAYSTSGTTTMTPTITGVTGSTYYSELSTKTATTGDSVTTFIVDNGPYNDGDWFTIGQIPDSLTSSLTGNAIVSPIGEFSNQNWYNNYYTPSSGTITGVDAFLFVYSGSSHSFVVTKVSYSASVNHYDGITVAALRSRGKYTQEVLHLEVTSSTGITLTSSTVATNPLGEFTLSVTGATAGSKTFTCSLDNTSTKFISKVLGTEVFDKDETEFPLYVHEQYATTLSTLYQKGLVRGLSLTDFSHTDNSDFLVDYDTPATPMVVSEVRGGKVADLFQVYTVSDGESANKDVKITIANIDLDASEFDLYVRDYNDTDDNQVVLEKYTRCSMDPSLPSYIGTKVGTTDGEYTLNSKFIIISLADNAPTDAVPAGFKGYVANYLASANTLGLIQYKTQYFNSGDETGLYSVSDGTPVTAAQTDKIKKVSLGISSTIGFDDDLFKYKGQSASKVTLGFHLSMNAGSITGNTITGKAYDVTPYDLEGIDKGMLSTVAYRKFTFAPAGGFDGWDIYRSVRTTGNKYIYGQKTYISGWTQNGGVFDKNNGNSDYYAYLKGMQTFSNPEAVDINVFATPGLNFFDHSSLTFQAIDMIENERADSLYIIGSRNVTTAQEVVDDMETIGIDSNYSATYWPWIQVRDTDNATQLFIPPTGEVARNIALTDNVSYPWFAVAGYSRGLVKSIKAVKKLTLDERDTLYKARINPIATFSDTGTIIWGNKTLQVRESALDRINVRRLLLRARKLISAVAVRLLFEQNDDQVRQEFLRLVNPILDAIKKERGLYDFRVSVSNDPADIDANTLRGKIYVKPTRALEFIDLEFIITPTGASFENI